MLALLSRLLRTSAEGRSHSLRRSRRKDIVELLERKLLRLNHEEPDDDDTDNIEASKDEIG